jgi:hypothetical protein
MSHALVAELTSVVRLIVAAVAMTFVHIIRAFVVQAAAVWSASFTGIAAFVIRSTTVRLSAARGLGNTFGNFFLAAAFPYFRFATAFFNFRFAAFAVCERRIRRKQQREEQDQGRTYHVSCFFLRP